MKPVELMAALRQRFPRMRAAYISLALVGLMWVLPFEYGEHYFPLTTFYQEWMAAALGLAAMFLLAIPRFPLKSEVPRIILWPLGFIGIIWLQYLVGKIEYAGLATLLSLYLLWAAMLILLGRRLREELGLPFLATALAMVLLLGAEISALVGVAQKYAWHNVIFDYWVTVKDSGPIFANMGQPNHLADYTVLGLVSLGALYLHRKLPVWLVAVLALPLLFVLVLSASRSAWLYLFIMAAMSFAWQRRDKTLRHLLYFSLALILGFGMMHLVAKIPFLAGNSGSTVTAMDRAAEAVGLASGATRQSASLDDWIRSSPRFSVWHETLIVFGNFPILGVGVGHFAWQHFLIGAQIHNTAAHDLYNHSHNILLDTAAEMGVIGLVVLLGSFGIWVWQVYRAPRTLYHWWGAIVVAVLLTHSLLEYPLWYAYFLGLMAVSLGIMDETVYRLRPRWMMNALAACILAFGIFSISELWLGYKKLAQANAPVPAESYEYMRRLNFERLRFMQGAQGLFFQPYIEIMLGDLGWNHVGDKGALNERTMRYYPSSPIVYREVTILARLGKMDEAKAQLERAIWIFPGDFQNNLEQLRKLAEVDDDPNRFPVLVTFGIQKFEEYKRYVDHN